MFMDQRKAMTLLMQSKGQRIVIGTQERQERRVVNTRVTYGCGVQLTLDKPLTGKSSPLVTVTMDQPTTAIDLARGLQGETKCKS